MLHLNREGDILKPLKNFESKYLSHRYPSSQSGEDLAAIGHHVNAMISEVGLLLLVTKLCPLWSQPSLDLSAQALCEPFLLHVPQTFLCSTECQNHVVSQTELLN